MAIDGRARAIQLISTAVLAAGTIKVDGGDTTHSNAAKVKLWQKKSNIRICAANLAFPDRRVYIPVQILDRLMKSGVPKAPLFFVRRIVKPEQMFRAKNTGRA
ncbi:hypothetical protein [uncultured Agrobacterium sp.]|uniref:hypothetical protein n=1 Tax=uncultured Agrobacterium sp. TaxID=157277 RepID=UPI0025FA4C44|nr:hypothetical protein [uncultured Agrobacterium sp.]